MEIKNFYYSVGYDCEGHFFNLEKLDENDFVFTYNINLGYSNRICITSKELVEKCVNYVCPTIPFGPIFVEDMNGCFFAMEPSEISKIVTVFDWEGNNICGYKDAWFHQINKNAVKIK